MRHDRHYPVLSLLGRVRAIRTRCIRLSHCHFMKREIELRNMVNGGRQFVPFRRHATERLRHSPMVPAITGGCTGITGFRYRQWLVRKSNLFRIRRRPSDGRAKPECPVMAKSRPWVIHFGMSALRRLADIAVLAIDLHLKGSGNPFFSVYLVWP